MTYELFYNITREQMFPTPYQNSPIVPLLLLTLVSQKNAPQTTTRIQREYDYIVVGAGAAGSVVAARLAENPCTSVLLLEAGDPPPLLTDIPVLARTFLMTDIDWNYLTEPQKYTGASLINRQMTWAAGKTLGGSTVINAMLHIRGNRDDYDNWARLGARGWSWREVYPYFLKLEDNKDPDIAHNGFHGIGGPVPVTRPPYQSVLQDAILESALSLGYHFVDPNGRYQIGISDFQANILDGQRYSTAKAYLVPNEHKKNLDIVAGALVTKVTFSGRRAKGVLFDHKGYQDQVVIARKEVILSAGTVNTAQLLMLSGIGPRETLQQFNIPVIADLPVGLNFHDQSSNLMDFVVNTAVSSLPEKVISHKNVKLYSDRKSGPLASTEGVISMAFLHNNRTYQGDDVPPDHAIYFAEAALLSVKAQIGLQPSVYEQLYEPFENKTVLWCLSTVLHPKSRGYVSIRSNSPYDPPVIDPNYFENPQDMYDIVSGMKSCLRIIDTPSLRRLGVDPFEKVVPGCEKFPRHSDSCLECIARSIAFTISNAVGTAKMGDPSDPTTVVDPELRVKGISGLRVVDASVMPTVPSGNTMVPTIMIAEKASDIIKCSSPWN